MSAKDRVRWDKVYKQRARESYPNPDPFLLQYTPPAIDENVILTALDLAGGVGEDVDLHVGLGLEGLGAGLVGGQLAGVPHPVLDGAGSRLPGAAGAGGQGQGGRARGQAAQEASARQ